LKSLKKCTKSRRVRRLVSAKATGEMLTWEIARPFAEILSVSTFGGGVPAHNSGCSENNGVLRRHRVDIWILFD
jgi:hypothetical protein